MNKPACIRRVAPPAEKDWIVCVEKLFRRSTHMLARLDRDTHRVDVVNSDCWVTDEQVAFRAKPGRTATLEPVEFLACLIQQGLSRGFQQIRHAGLHAFTRSGRPWETPRPRTRHPRFLGWNGKRTPAWSAAAWTQNMKRLQII